MGNGSHNKYRSYTKAICTGWNRPERGYFTLGQQIFYDSLLCETQAHETLGFEIDIAWLNQNYGNTKDIIKPQVDKYTIDGKDIIVLAETKQKPYSYWQRGELEEEGYCIVTLRE